jgi:hypothetical protein
MVGGGGGGGRGMGGMPPQLSAADRSLLKKNGMKKKASEAKKMNMQIASDMGGGFSLYNERLFFEKCREVLSIGVKNQGWYDFTKALDNYARAYITRVELIQIAGDCLAKVLFIYVLCYASFFFLNSIFF